MGAAPARIIRHSSELGRWEMALARELDDTSYGSREYVCRDPEGNLWCFGTYDPFA